MVPGTEYHRRTLITRLSIRTDDDEKLLYSTLRQYQRVA